MTVNPAKIFGVADRMGTLAVGMTANLVVMTGDFLDPKSTVKTTVVEGVATDAKKEDCQVKTTASLAALVVAAAAHAQTAPPKSLPPVTPPNPAATGVQKKGTDQPVAPAPTKSDPGASRNLPSETAADRKPRLHTNGDVFIMGGRILTATHGTIEKGNILVRNGKIVAIGPERRRPRRGRG